MAKKNQYGILSVDEHRLSLVGIENTFNKANIEQCDWAKHGFINFVVFREEGWGDFVKTSSVSLEVADLVFKPTSDFENPNMSSRDVKSCQRMLSENSPMTVIINTNTAISAKTEFSVVPGSDERGSFDQIIRVIHH